MTHVKKIKNDKAGVTSPLESLTAFSIVFIMIAFLFIGANGFFQSYPTTEADLYIKNIHAAESLITDTGITIDGSPFWEENPKELEVLGLAAPNIIEGFMVFNNNSGGFIYSIFTPWSGTWSTTGGLWPDILRGPHITTQMCFLAGTKVLMADGSYKNIEDIATGEKVFCFDENNDTVVVGKVVHVFHHDTPDELARGYFVVNDHLCVTPNHMLLTKEGWRTVGSLRVGDRLANGELVFSLKPVIKRVATYDLDVEPFDSYLVLGSKDMMVAHNRNYLGVIENGTGNDPTQQSITYGIAESFPATKPRPDAPNGSIIDWVSDPKYPGGGYWTITTLGFAMVTDTPVISSYDFKITDINIVTDENGNNGSVVVHYKYTTDDDNRYAILDWKKTQAMKEIPYEKAKEALGIDPGYDFYLNITYLNGSVLLEYPKWGVDYDNADVVTSFSRNVVIFRETRYNKELVSDDVGKDVTELVPFLRGSRELANFELIIYR